MSSVQDHLQRWLDAGVLDAATAERIRNYEASRAAPAGERPTIVEALIYLGLAIGAVGVIVLVAANWERLAPWAHIAVPAVPAVLALAAGQALRSSAAPELRRGGAVLWAAAVALTALTVAAIGLEAGWPEGDIAIAAGVAGSLIAAALWALEPSHPQVLVLEALLLQLGISLGALPEEGEFSVPAAGLTVVLFGAASVGLAELGLLRPQLTSRIAAAAVLAAGALFLNTDETERLWAELVAPAVGAGLVVLGINRPTFIYIAAGVGVFFVGLIALVLRRLEDPTLAALALMFLGVLLIGAVMLLSRLRPWQHTPA
ncbi:MAG TPA: DUF2157 domain-containing protein [Dehalococcoidia bacterium]|nr:DUF2157 domain-containing protein [Dehalococcoidia bacterium]